MKSVADLLKGDAWKTSMELVNGTGRTYSEIMSELHSSATKGLFLGVNVPGDAKVIYHCVTPETRFEACQQRALDFTALPWNLKTSAARKVESMHRSGLIGSGLPEWMRAVMKVEKSLVSAGLYELRSRPREGFFYSCSWRVEHPPNPPDRERHLLYIDFMGVVHIMTGVPEGNVVHPDTNNIKRWITLRHDSATVSLSDVARATLKRTVLGFTHLPSREKIIASTKKMLLDAAADEEKAAVFLPLHPAEFKLLSANETTKEEAHSCQHQD